MKRLTHAILGITGTLALAPAALSETLKTDAAPDITGCPDSFYSVPLPDSARQCQPFDDTLPASMVYFSHLSGTELIRYYTDALPNLEQRSPVSGRVLLTSSDSTVRIVVSPDKNGTQIDILVASTPTS